MKKRKIIIVTAVMLIMVIAVGVITIHATKDRSDIVASENIYTVRKSAKKEKVLSLAVNDKFVLKSLDGIQLESNKNIISKNGTKLQYIRSENYTNVRRYDVYTDDSGNEYSYDMTGMLTEFKLNELTSNVNSANAEKLYNEKEATELAREYAHLLYGDKFDDFEFEWSLASEETHTYTFSFIKKYGFAAGPHCFIDICTNGVLLSCDLIGYNEYDDFNDDLLNGVTEDTVKAYVDDQIKLKYSETLDNYDIDSINIKKLDGKYNIIVAVNIAYRVNEGSITNVGQKYYYPL